MFNQQLRLISSLPLMSPTSPLSSACEQTHVPQTEAGEQVSTLPPRCFVAISQAHPCATTYNPPKCRVLRHSDSILMHPVRVDSYLHHTWCLEPDACCIRMPLCIRISKSHAMYSMQPWLKPHCPAQKHCKNNVRHMGFSSSSSRYRCPPLLP